MTSIKSIYCFDTSGLITMTVHYPHEIFPSLWERLDELVASGRLIAPREVRRELEKFAGAKNPALDWIKKHNSILHFDPQQLELVTEIQKIFPRLVDWSKEEPDADPFVISLAHVRTCGVVSAEKLEVNPTARPKIPNVCQYYNIPHLTVQDVFRVEKWKI